jgi:hypothetical protein
LAAERVGRRAFTMEVEPGFVDVAIKRWQAFSRKDAIHADSGLTFDELASTRNATVPDLAIPMSAEQAHVKANSPPQGLTSSVGGTRA